MGAELAAGGLQRAVRVTRLAAFDRLRSCCRPPPTPRERVSRRVSRDEQVIAAIRRAGKIGRDPWCEAHHEASRRAEATAVPAAWQRAAAHHMVAVRQLGMRAIQRAPSRGGLNQVCRLGPDAVVKGRRDGFTLPRLTLFQSGAWRIWGIRPIAYPASPDLGSMPTVGYELRA